MMIPKDWERYALGKITETITSGSRDWAQYYSDVGSKFIRMTNLPRDGIYLKLDDLKYVDVKSDSSDGQRTSLNSGDILISITAELGKIGWVPDNLGEAYINQHTALVRLKSKFTDSKFIAYLLSSKEMNHKINRLNDSGAKAGLNLSTIRAIPLLLPPIPEQRKIATTLGTWDKAINTTERLIDNSKQQKKALMQQLLTGKKRLLDDSGKPFQGEWEKVNLKSIAEMNSGGTPKSSVPEYYGGEIPWVSIADMTKHGKWISKTEKHLTEDGLNNSSARLYPKGTVLYAMYASIGECSIASVELSSSQAILGIRASDKLLNLYLYYFLANLKTKITLMGQQGTQSNLNAGMVKDFIVNLPSMAEQQKIASVLTTADKEIDFLEQHLADLKKEKKALMQQLLTGKKRVLI